MDSCYDADYYNSRLAPGLPYDRTHSHWLIFFGKIADEIARKLAPRRVLDVGCAKGFLVEALRDQGIEAFGFDISEYAIGEVRPDIRQYCWVGKVTDPLPQDYDLITCIEVLEHVSAPEARMAVENMCARSEGILFSSTPNDDGKEPTHVNVRPVLDWLKLFREFSFSPDPEFDTGFVSPQAVFLRKTPQRASDDLLANIAAARNTSIANISLQMELAATRQELRDTKHELGTAGKQVADLQHSQDELKRELGHLQDELKNLTRHLENIESSLGWQVTLGFRRLRDRILREGTRRRSLADKALRATRIVCLEGVSGVRRVVQNKRSQFALNLPYLNGYAEWIRWNEPDKHELHQQRNLAKQFNYRPRISVVMPTWNPNLNVLRDTVQSVRNQTYENWEILLAGGCLKPEDSARLAEEFDNQDARIHVKILTDNLGISGNSNEAMRMATGEFIALLDHDDLLAPSALFEVVKLLNNTPELDFIYTDKDGVSADGKTRYAPLFKPEWSPEMLLSANYLTHLCVIRRSLAVEVGGFRPETDGAQDWDFFLRVLDRTSHIARIPQVLYHWRAVSTSVASGIGAKPYALKRQIEVIEGHLLRRGLKANASFTPLGYLRVAWPTSGRSRVSIVIPNPASGDRLKTCIETLLEKTTYKNFEILIAENGNTQPPTLPFYDELAGRANIRIVDSSSVRGVSAVNNFAADQATGDILLFLSSDTEITDGGWLEEMVRWAELERIGVVGAKLLKEDGTIQHAGVVIGLTGVAGDLFSGLKEGHYGPFGSTEWYRDYSAITGDCLMVRRDLYERVGKFSEDFQRWGSDVEFCLRVRLNGYRVMYTPFATLLHRGTLDAHSIPQTDLQVSFSHLEPYLREGDPFFNPNLSYWKTMPHLRKTEEPVPLDFARQSLEGTPMVAKTPRRSLSQKAKSGLRKAFNKAIPTWTWYRVQGSLPLWARYSYDAAALAQWLDFNQEDLAKNRRAIASGKCCEQIRTINWLIPDFHHAAYGGIHTILRFAAYLSKTKRVQNRFVVIGSGDTTQLRSRIAEAFPELSGEPVIGANSQAMEEIPDADACIASLWTTAYLLLKFNRTKRKFYFIQDFEPLFYPAGSTSAQVEATYGFEFYGITNTRTLKEIYERNYAGKAEFFNPAVDLNLFHPSGLRKNEKRIKVFFYCRPEHPRNGFELGLAALRKAKQRLGDRVEIVSAGAFWDPKIFQAEGIVENLGLLPYEETANLYRTCDLGLLLMFTRHPSYIPLELMASGCVVVSNVNPATSWLMQHGTNCLLSRSSASCLAESIVTAATNADLREQIRSNGNETVQKYHSDWEIEMEKIFDFMCNPEPSHSVVTESQAKVSA